MPTTPYAGTADLLLHADLPIPAGLTREQFLIAAADEIHMRIAQRYKTPIVFTTAEEQEEYAATLTLLKTLNAHLATGRLVMAIDVKGERTRVHSYGNNLVKGALELIEEIVNGKVDLEGAIPSTASGDFGSTRPMISQTDPYSNVEAFYNGVAALPVYGPRIQYIHVEPGY